MEPTSGLYEEFIDTAARELIESRGTDEGNWHEKSTETAVWCRWANMHHYVPVTLETSKNVPNDADVEVFCSLIVNEISKNQVRAQIAVERDIRAKAKQILAGEVNAGIH